MKKPIVVMGFVLLMMVLAVPAASKLNSFADLVAAATFDGGHNLRVRGRHGERRSWNAASNLER